MGIAALYAQKLDPARRFGVLHDLEGNIIVDPTHVRPDIHSATVNRILREN
jgi:hypothetical protein